MQQIKGTRIMKPNTPHRSGLRPRVDRGIQSYYRKTPTGGYYAAFDGYTGNILAVARTLQRIEQIIGRIETRRVLYGYAGRA